MSLLDDIRASVSKMLDDLDPKSPISATVVFKVKKSAEKSFNKNATALAEAFPFCDLSFTAARVFVERNVVRIDEVLPGAFDEPRHVL